ncbi:ESX-1 secretion-associated protein EspI-like [Hippopotamus amphibius kiboko]|uniref:ESX-1 secretion-associated protein EspI-like n=1 Tax=Hippopotamus amphibius kiboko TaxID=575201 RepID=UPI00259932C1|nr:ESX-1 secretion-associated protein EspI-like [Hippopotamus amphibius kiboko]
MGQAPPRSPARAGALRAPAMPNFPNPSHGVRRSASSRSRAASSQAGCEAALGTGLLGIPTPLPGNLPQPPRGPQTPPSHDAFPPVPAPSPLPEKLAEERGGARVPAPRARAAGAAKPHLPDEAAATHPHDVPLRPHRPHRRLFRRLRTLLVATAPSAAAVAAVLAAAAARVRPHAHRRGRARASARWRHLATDRRRPGGLRGFRAGRSSPAGFAAFPHPPDSLPSQAGGPRAWLPCRHLAPGGDTKFK